MDITPYVKNGGDPPFHQINWHNDWNQLAQRLAPHHNLPFLTPLPIPLTFSIRNKSSSGTAYKTIGDMFQSCQSNPYFERFEMKNMKLYITFHIHIYII